MSACRSSPPPKPNAVDPPAGVRKTHLPPKPISAAATNTPRPTFTATAPVLPPPVPKNTQPQPTPNPITSSVAANPSAPTSLPTAAPLLLTDTPLPPPQSSQPTAAVGTATATVAPTLPNDTPTPLPTDTPATILTPTTVPTAVDETWEFAHLRQIPNDDGELTITGELVNKSNQTQTLNFIGGEFFDASGTKVAGDDDISDYWLTENIPPGGALPFELVVDNISQAADFSLTAHAEPAPVVTRTDFQVSITEQYSEPEYYCLDGTVSFSAPLNEYLEVIVTGYAADGSIISFNDDYFTSSDSLGSSVDFSVCLDDTDPPSIDHHTLQVWGE